MRVNGIDRAIVPELCDKTIGSVAKSRWWWEYRE